MPRRKPTEPHWSDRKRLGRTIKRRDKANDWLSPTERGLTKMIFHTLYVRAMNHPEPKYIKAMHETLVKKLADELAKLEQ